VADLVEDGFEHGWFVRFRGCAAGGSFEAGDFGFHSFRLERLIGWVLSVAFGGSEGVGLAVVVRFRDGHW
jgi:hypothetical protein